METPNREGLGVKFWWPVAESNHGHADFQSKTLAFFLFATTKKRNDFSVFRTLLLNRPNLSPNFSLNYALFGGAIGRGGSRKCVWRVPNLTEPRPNLVELAGVNLLSGAPSPQWLWMLKSLLQAVVGQKPTFTDFA